MRVRRALLSLLVFATIPVAAPLDATTFPPNLSQEKRGEIVSAISSMSDASQTYELYLPSGFTPERFTASRRTDAARWLAGISFRLPPYFPIGVRTASTT